MIKWVLTPMVILMVCMILSCSQGEIIPGGSGLVEANEVIISAETAGRLENLYYDDGNKVNRGDIIALIDTTTVVLRLEQTRAIAKSIRAQRQNALISIEQAELNDSLASKEYRRISRLVKAGSANQQQYDRAENAYQQARLGRKAAAVALDAVDAELARVGAEIKLLEKQLADCRPMSPVSGTVVTTYIEKGELVAQGKPILKVARLDTVWVKIYLPPEDLTKIKLGETAEVDPEDGRTTPLSGVISWISSEAEFTPKNVQTKQARADLVYAVKVIVPNADEALKIGMPVSVSIP